ncbi:hypothetical protein Mgra_00004250 [Meloidogyne graminicola]|uniref:Uncharacterized protein n=1 Tax=Meloidogyne graminicola TaxID=189291 RepID=A0A8S9ZSY2_9BILA|nr:hypothetical protein Mgra_00004250 [Meloidogyne graminicola]
MIPSSINIFIFIICLPSFNLTISLYGSTSLLSNNNFNNQNMKIFKNYNLIKNEYKIRQQGNKRNDNNNQLHFRKKYSKDEDDATTLRLIQLITSLLNSKQKSSSYPFISNPNHNSNLFLTSPFSNKLSPSNNLILQNKLDKYKIINENEKKNENKEKIIKEEDPLVIRHYNRDCFFTPINCFVGKAGEEATNIVGSASNSKRQILFIRRRN